MLETDIRRAFEQEEFVIEYQPKVDLTTYQITGAEALLRWFHPTRGMVSPDDFVKVAEDMGLIGPIGKWVLETVLKQLQPNRSRITAMTRPLQVIKCFPHK